MDITSYGGKKFRQTIVHLVMICAAMHLSACGSESKTSAQAKVRKPILKGQVFIRTQDGGIIKFGGTQVNIYAMEKLLEHLRLREDIAVAKVDEINASIKSSSDSLAKAQNDFADTQKSLSGLETKLEAEEKSYEKAKARATAKYEVLNANRKVAKGLVDDTSNELRSAQNSLKSAQEQVKRFTAEHDSFLLSRAEKDVQKFEAQVKQYEKQLTANEVALNEQKSEWDDYKKIENELQAAAEPVNAARNAIAELQTVISSKRQKCEGIVRILNELDAEASKFHDRSYLLQNLPQPAFTAVSDSEGRFQSELPPNCEVALYTSVSRDIRRADIGQTLTHTWFIRKAMADQDVEVILSNLNVFGTDSSDQIVKHQKQVN